MTHLFSLSLVQHVVLSASSSVVLLFALMLAIIFSTSSSQSLPCFLNRSALIRSCSIIVLWLVVFIDPFIHTDLIFIHVSKSCRCLLSASFRRYLNARCWFLRRLKVTRSLHNPRCACLLSLLADIEGRSVATICLPAPGGSTCWTCAGGIQ